MQNIISFPGGFTPQVAGLTQFDLVVLDEQVDRVIGFAFKDNHIPASKFELRAEKSTRVGAGDGAGQRAFGNDRVAPRGGGHGAGQRAGGHNHFVVRSECFAGRIDFLT